MPDGAWPGPPWKREEPLINGREEAGLNRVALGIFEVHMPGAQASLRRLLPFALAQGVLFLADLLLTRVISGWMIRVSVRNIPSALWRLSSRFSPGDRKCSVWQSAFADRNHDGRLCRLKAEALKNREAVS